MVSVRPGWTWGDERCHTQQNQKTRNRQRRGCRYLEMSGKCGVWRARWPECVRRRKGPKTWGPKIRCTGIEPATLCSEDRRSASELTPSNTNAHTNVAYVRRGCTSLSLCPSGCMDQRPERAVVGYDSLFGGADFFATEAHSGCASGPLPLSRSRRRGRVWIWRLWHVRDLPLYIKVSSGGTHV
eukprot:scaffold19434_cov114-Isochrysis_galbana.AAC.5